MKWDREAPKEAWVEFKTRVRLGRRMLPLCLLVGLVPGISGSRVAGSTVPPTVSIECLARSPNAYSLPRDRSLDGSWRQLRRDRRLTGRSPLIGTITCPIVRWAWEPGLRRQLLALRPGGDSNTVVLPAEGRQSGREQDYDPRGVLIDLDGDGANLRQPAGPFERIGDFRPELPGWERVTCDTADTNSGSGENGSLPCALQNRTNGDWETIWETVPLRGFVPGLTTAGNPIVADVDGDGEDEAVVVGWFDLYVLNLTSGAVEQTSTFLPDDDQTGASPRAYGWLGAYDLAGDDRLEVVVLGDKEQFLSMHGWVDGRLEEVWDRQISAGVSFQTTKHHPGPKAVADTDGDGRPEIATTIFNQNGDQSWHVVVVDGASGEIELDLAGWYLSGLDDLTADGVAELLVSSSQGQAVSDSGGIQILSLRQGGPTVLWSSAREGFELYNVPELPTSVNSWTTYALRTVFVRRDWNGAAVFATRSSLGGDLARISLYQWVEDAFAPIASVDGPALDLLSLPTTTPELGILLRGFTEGADESSAAAQGGTLELVATGPAERGDGPAGAAESLLRNTLVSRGETPTVVTERFDETLHGLRVESQGSVTEAWRSYGRGMADGQSARWSSDVNALAPSVLANLEGDGTDYIVTAGRTSSNQGPGRDRAFTGWAEPIAGAPSCALGSRRRKAGRRRAPSVATSRALVNRTSRPRSSRMLYRGIQYTPVDSIATVSIPHSWSQLASWGKSAVKVPNFLVRSSHRPSGTDTQISREPRSTPAASLLTVGNDFILLRLLRFFATGLPPS